MQQGIDHSIPLKFGELYTHLRRAENRLVTDEELALLPQVNDNHPYSREWKMRLASAKKLLSYISQRSHLRKLLEIGSGNGWLSNYLSVIPSIQITAIDSNEYEIAQAKRVHQKNNLQFINAELGDPEIEADYDLIIFAASIHYFPSLRKALAVATRLLRPGGEIHILDSQFYKETEKEKAKQRSADHFQQLGFPEMRHHYFHRSWNELKDVPHEVLYRPHGWQRLLQQDPVLFPWIRISKNAWSRKMDKEHLIRELPLVILMPHSSCNCRCIMCDIWKGNANKKQLQEEDIRGLLHSLEKLRTRQVLFSGGEALLHPAFFRLCSLLKEAGLRLSLLSSGLSIEGHAADIVRYIDELTISLDGDPETHDRIRNIPGAFWKLKAGIIAIKRIKKDLPITARTVVQQHNFRNLSAIVDTAMDAGFDQISFFPADLSSSAFNREIPWEAARRSEIAVEEKDLPVLKESIETLVAKHSALPGYYIAESSAKLRQIYQYYTAIHSGHGFPSKKCNAPWISAVVDPEGMVQPCFFHPATGNIRQNKLETILNAKAARDFREELDLEQDPVCKKCVCSLYRKPGAI